jgi:hypothetical protein
LIAILLSGEIYSKVSVLFHILGTNIGSKDYYHSTVVTKVDDVVKQEVEKFILQCRQLTPDVNDVHVTIDAGWSHPGWWARECTIIAVDGKTGLPIAMKHIIKDFNYEGSSKGT